MMDYTLSLTEKQKALITEIKANRERDELIYALVRMIENLQESFNESLDAIESSFIFDPRGLNDD